MTSLVSDHDSMDDLIKEIEKGETSIVITKDVRKFRKPVTVVSGLQDNHNAKDVTRQLKTSIGTGGTFKDGQIILQGDHREDYKGPPGKDGLQRRLDRGVSVAFRLPTHRIVTLQLIFRGVHYDMQVEGEAQAQSTLKEQVKPEDSVKEKEVISGKTVQILVEEESLSAG